MYKLTKISFAIVVAAAFIQPSCKRETPTPKATSISCNDINYQTTLIDRFLDPEVADYTVSCNVSIKAMLTISPGVVIEFAPNTGFNVSSSGYIVAAGTSDKPIVFKGSADTPGSWKGVYINSYGTQNQLSYVTITGGGSQSYASDNILANIRLGYSSSVQLDHCTISNSLGDGMYAEGSSVTGNNPVSGFSTNSFTNNTGYPVNINPVSLAVMDATTSFTGNGKQFVCLRGAGIEMNQQWNPMQVPYFVDSIISIGADFEYGSLLVSPGVKMVFGADAGLIVPSSYGYLKLSGSSASRITLTGETSVPGSWLGINIQSYSSNNQFNCADISYGGCCPFPNAFSTDLANILVGGFSTGKLSLTNCTINNSGSCGLRIKSGSVVSPNTGNTLTGNASTSPCN